MRIATLILAATLCTAQLGMASDSPGGGARGGSGCRDGIRAHFEQQRQENQAFRETLRNRDMNPAERLAAIKAHRETQHAENQSFLAQTHAQCLAQLRARLEQNDRLTAEQKQERIAFFEQQFSENAAMHEQSFTAFLAFIDSLAANPELTPEQRRTAMREFVAAQKAAMQRHREQQRAEREAKREELRPPNPPAERRAERHGAAPR